MFVVSISLSIVWVTFSRRGIFYRGDIAKIVPNSLKNQKNTYVYLQISRNHTYFWRIVYEIYFPFKSVVNTLSLIPQLPNNDKYVCDCVCEGE